MIVSIINILSVLLPILITVAYITLLERKVLASMQRRVGPDTTGVFGILQPFADAAKLLVKEIVLPLQAQKTLFVLAPAITLASALIGWAIIPFGNGLIISDLELGWLFYLAVASVGIYGIIFGGWAANSAYALLGGIRSTAHMVSYELVLSGAALGALLMAGSFSLLVIVAEQSYVWFFLPLLPIFLIFLISGLAEINRTPFDLVEAESELVSGFFTEHSGFIFVLFFLAEYSNIALISCIASTLFLGGYLLFGLEYLLFSGVALGFKALLLICTVIWVRGTLPRMRFDQLMIFCWTILLPVTFALVAVVLSVMVLTLTGY